MMLRRAVCLGVVGLFAVAASARAGDVDPFLPDDTEMVVSVNVKQIVESDLFKKYVEPSAREALKKNDAINDALKNLGVDPFTDVERLIVTRPSGVDQDRGLVIVHGRFDLDKFKDTAENAAKDHPDVVKVHKISDGAGGKFLVYEVTTGEQSPPIFLTLPNKTTVLVSPGKDYVVDAVKRDAAGQKPKLKNADMQALLERMDDKQGVSVAMVGAALTEGASQEVKDLFAKVEAVGGGVSVGDEIMVEIAVTAKDADDAKDVKESIGNRLKQARLLAAALALADDPKLEALLEVLNAVRVSIKDKTVLLKATVGADLIEDAFKQDAKDK